ncbi:unnamed protein product [Fraxinus pennsylvanica]|uniref:MLO-like protein n=1 Tax=Fraxinus pennsylvanica TaxID=56036 RepID=A0AAD2ADG3_9LAMI|nr:unnamed protein product [Fraxinus pennsylvanica]
MEGGGRSFEYTPTWIVALVCLIIVFISLCAERGLHLLGKCFLRKGQNALNEALQKLKEELMLLGFISLLLTVFQGLISDVSEWRHWEHSIRKEISRPHHGHPRIGHHFKEFKERSGKYWRKFHVVSWMAAFFKQFYGSVTRSDYIALRSGFVQEHCPGNPDYDFHKYMLRTVEEDFKKIIGISWYLWLFVVVFLLLNIAGWHTYFWLSFLPLVLLLIVGAKLEHIITQLAKDAAERTSGDPEGTEVKPSDELFWFHRPEIVLYLIHFILFQNSFEVAFFFWIVCTYGFKSCIIEELVFIIPRLVVGIIVQVLCSYSTLPLYALVTQMGSMFKKTVFEESTQGLILDWIGKSQSGLGKARSTQTDKLAIELAQGSTSIVEQSHAKEISVSTMECPSLNRSHMPSSSL